MNIKRTFSFMSILNILMGLFLSTVIFAAETGASTAGATGSEGASNSALTQIIMLAAFAFIFYFLVFRPQSKRAKEHRVLVTRLQKGDEILTSGGILGKISRVTDDFFVVAIADNIEVMVQKQAVASALPKGTMKSIQ